MIQKMTSAQASKYLKQLQAQLSDMYSEERKVSTFVAATTEDIEEVRPAYDFVDVQFEAFKLEKRIRAVKHAINKFNTNYVIPEFDMTIDEMLVLLPQLTTNLNRFTAMKNTQPKTRLGSSANGIIEYRYINYEMEDAVREYNETYEKLSKAQIALDVANNTELIDIEMS